MKLISYVQNDNFKNIRNKLIIVRELHDFIIRYDTEPEMVINTLASRTDIDVNNFINIKDGLIGINTKDKTITLGFKYLKELFIKVIDDIMNEYKLVLENNQVNVVADNVKSVLSDILVRNVLINNIDAMNDSLPAKEFATNTFIIFLEKQLGKGVDQSQWLDCLLQTLTTNIISEKEPIPFYDNRLVSFINAKLTHISNNKGNGIYVTDKSVMNRVNSEVLNTALPEDIKEYVDASKGTAGEIYKQVLDITEILFNIEDNITKTIEQLPDIDYILIFNVLKLIRNTVEEYGDGKITKDIYCKLMVEYVNVYIDIANAYINVNDRVITETININRNIKLVYLAKTMFENMIIEGSISYKG